MRAPGCTDTAGPTRRPVQARASPELRRAGWLALVMAAAAACAVALTPRQYLADLQPREPLAQLVPRAFGDWRVDDGVRPLQPSSDLQQIIARTYTETLARTYRHRDGRRVMLSVAYGRNQHKGMNTHRPEVCYPAQGFHLVAPGVPGPLHLGDRRIDAVRLVAAMGPRVEPITYWLMVGDEITRFGAAQRWVVVRRGLLHGEIPDGVLVRVSSIDADAAAAFALHEAFIRDLLDGLGPARRPRLLGRA